MKCLVPETGLTIDPIGEIVLCCAGDNVSIGHIKDIDDITDRTGYRPFSGIYSR